MAVTSKQFAPVHPGEVLREEFLKPLKLSQNALARALAVDPRRVNDLVNEKRSMTADTALRLSKYFGTSAEVWLNLQTKYDLEVAKEKLGKRIMKEVATSVVKSEKVSTA
jgi:addiction module HigA family antidote